MDKIRGLALLPDFITPSQERHLAALIEAQEWGMDLKRRTQHYGYKYGYRTRRLDPAPPIPEWLLPTTGCVQNAVAEAAAAAPAPGAGAAAAAPARFDQVIVNEYKSGQCITRHVDSPQCFGDTIASLSMGADCVMTFSRAGAADKPVNALLPQRSLLVLAGEARRSWAHEIPDPGGAGLCRGNPRQTSLGDVARRVGSENREAADQD